MSAIPLKADNLRASRPSLLCAKHAERDPLDDPKRVAKWLAYLVSRQHFVTEF
jgi:hypothetical protein